MIKTDAQLERTRESIEGFRIQLREAAAIDDEAERELTCASYQGMITMLELEIERYLNAKRGVVRVPRTIHSILDLCPYLTDIRIALAWTQEMLASRLNVTRQAVNQWEEHEYRNLDVSRLQQIIDVLGLQTLIRVNHSIVTLHGLTEIGPQPVTRGFADTKTFDGWQPYVFSETAVRELPKAGAR